MKKKLLIFKIYFRWNQKELLFKIGIFNKKYLVTCHKMEHIQ